MKNLRTYTIEGQKGSIYRIDGASESNIPIIAKITRWILETEQDVVSVNTHDRRRPAFLGRCKRHIFAEGTTEEFTNKQIHYDDEVVLRLHLVGSPPLHFKCSVDTIDGSKYFKAKFNIDKVIPSQVS